MESEANEEHTSRVDSISTETRYHRGRSVHSGVYWTKKSLSADLTIELCKVLSRGTDGRVIGNDGGTGGSWVFGEVVVVVDNGWSCKARETMLVEGLLMVVFIIDSDEGK